MLELKKGDAILFHSDGLSECFNPEGELFGELRIKSLFGKIATETPSRIIKQLMNAANEWMGKSEPRDDITLVVIKLK
jgi:sigma-B regulation protein RsbU (phosphoserine phosphatase)